MCSSDLILLVREAGGTVSDMRGGPVKLQAENILADNGLLHTETLALFGEVYAGKYREALPELS